jgi:pyruvate formate lyase activating enzyme
MGRFKWKELKLGYTLDEVQPPTVEAVERACELFRAEGLKAY